MKTALSSILIIAVLAGAPGFAQQTDLAKDRVLLPGRAGVLPKDRVLLPGRAGAPSQDKVLYAVGYAHLDTEWRWDYQATIDQYIWNTMADNFRLIEKYPDYVFNFSGANRYRMMKEYYPQEFERVRKLAAEGRWFPAGSSMEENDALAPSYESVIRQILMGSNYFRKELGVSSEEYMLPDCFGFPASLPSILAHCGLKGFSTQKLSWGSARGIPFNLGRWIGPDGESVIAALNPGAYVTQVKEDLSVNPEWTKRVQTQGEKYGVFADYMYFGTGDVGGAPTEESVKWVEKSRESARNFKVVSAKADQLFKDITPAQKEALPATTGEFLLTNHSAGSVTSAAFMKRLNRKNEYLGFKAEAASVMGEWLGGAAYDRDRLAEAWRLVLGSQFHDILPGTSIPKAYEYAWNDGLLAANQFGRVLAGASGAVVRALNTRAMGAALVVFNPLAAVREDAVEAEVPFPAGAPKAVRVYDGGGREVPSQIVETAVNSVKVVFVAKVPSLGYAVFDVSPADSPCTLDTGLKAYGLSLENKRYAVRLGTDGDVVSIFDKAVKKELLAAPARLEFHYERPQDWPAWNMDWEDREKPASGYVEGTASIRIVENGPARVALEVVRESRHSKFVQRIRLAAAGGSDRVEFATAIDWATRESSLKAAFPLAVSNPLATYNFGVGTVERGNNDPAKFEVPSHEWFDLTDKDGSYGVSVLEDCKYGSDKPSDNTLRLTLLYTPGVRASYREQAVQDFGHHEVLYALYGHRGDWRTGDSGLQAARLNQPLVPFAAPAHPGPLGRSFSFLQVGSDNVVVSAVKKAELGDDLIVRVVESKGRAAKGVTIAFAAPVVAAREVDGQERDLRAAVVKDGRLVFDITPYHLRTFAVRLQPFAGPFGRPEGVSVDLPFDVDVISADGHKADGDMDGLGASYPAEMMPDAVRSGDVVFRLGPKADGAANAVLCQGQTVRLPEGKFDRLYVLAASAGRPERRPREGAGGSAFKVGDKSVAVDVANWSGYVGQWDRRLWAGDRPPATDEELNAAEYAGLAPAFLRPDDIALFTTHRHARNGANEAYEYAYAYKYAIDLPAGTRTVTLPDDRRVKILAMTAAWNENDATRPAAPLSDTLERDRGTFERFRACAKPVIVPEKAYVGYGSAVEVVMAAKDEGAVVRYTLDGSEPTEASPAYSGPVKVDRTCVLKAAAFHPARLPGAASVAYFSRSLPVKAVRYNVRPTSRRGGSIDMRALIDIRRAAADNYSAWQWFSGTDLDVVLDLGEMRTIEGIDLGCLENNRAWVFLPVAVEISVSDDDRGYRAVFSRDLGTPEKARPSGVAELRFDFTKTQARYIHVTAKNIGVLPKWHGSAGEKAWLAVDEIIVR